MMSVMAGTARMPAECYKDFKGPQSFPHIKFPTGPNCEALLSVMVDSCTGLNLGKLSHHESIYEQHPDLVSQFVYIKDGDNVEEFSISCVAEGEPG